MQNWQTNAQKSTERRKALTELTMQLSQIVYAMGFSGDLKPAQWAALRYFSRANASARTVTGFSRLNGVTKGAASQLITRMEAKGLVTIRPGHQDHRRRQIDLTELGRLRLELDPLNELARILAQFDDAQVQTLSVLMETLLRRPAIGVLSRVPSGDPSPRPAPSR